MFFNIYMGICVVFIDQFRGVRRAIGPLCARVRTVTIERNDLWLRYLALWFTLFLLRLCSKVKVVGKSLWLQDETTSTASAVCMVTAGVFWWMSFYYSRNLLSHSNKNLPVLVYMWHKGQQAAWQIVIVPGTVVWCKNSEKWCWSESKPIPYSLP